MNPEANPKRPIRSYVLRQGRVSIAQARAHDQLLPRYGIAYSAQPIDLEKIFCRVGPKILEIGFGMGESTATIAAAHPEIDYLGVEVHTPGVGSLLKLIDAGGLTGLMRVFSLLLLGLGLAGLAWLDRWWGTREAATDKAD